MSEIGSGRITLTRDFQPVQCMAQPPRQKILIAAGNDLPYAETLKAQGCEIVTAADAQRAYSAARQSAPDGAILDAHLPRGGAITVLQWLRSNVHTAAVPVVVIGVSGPEAKELLTAGAQECMSADAAPAEVWNRLYAHMGRPPMPEVVPAGALSNEARLTALKRTGLLDSPAEEAYDRLTKLAARLLNSPVAALTLIDRDRQFLKSQVGILGERTVPLSRSFCQWVVAGREPVVVEDARTHPVLKHNAAVRHMGVSAYAGIPVNSVDAQGLGAFCAVDSRPRTWTADQLETLGNLAKLAEVLVARMTLAATPHPSVADLKWYATAGTEAIVGAIRILRRSDLAQEDRITLLDEIETGVKSLMRVRATARATAPDADQAKQSESGALL